MIKKGGAMKKMKFKLEYPLGNASAAVLWNYTGNAQGLSAWFADEVLADENAFTFIWDKIEYRANLLHVKPNTYIRFQWEEDKNSDAFFEIKINSSEISKDVVIQITDFALPNEKEDSVMLWNKQMDDLKRVTGLI
jgi:hypothetical protein